MPTRQLRKAMFALAAGSCAVVSASAVQAVTYNIGWTGTDGYTMTGQIVFPDALDNSGVIDETEISDLKITGFKDGMSLGSWSLRDNGFANDPFGEQLENAFNVNFDTSATRPENRFAVGGLSSGFDGQLWNATGSGFRCNGFGFTSGNVAQGLCIDDAPGAQDDSFVGGVESNPGTLNATLARPDDPAVIPLPSSASVLLGALTGAGWALRNRVRGQGAKG